MCVLKAAVLDKPMLVHLQVHMMRQPTNLSRW